MSRAIMVLALIAAIVAGSGSVNALPTSHYAARSAMADGDWVKIKVNGEGMQRITYSQLKSMGFSDPSKVRVYGYGGYKMSELLNSSQIDDLPQLPVVRTGDAIYFFAVGTIKWNYAGATMPYEHEQNVYSTESYYFLSDRAASDIAPEKRTATSQPDAAVVTSFTELLLHERELVSLGETGSELFGEDFTSNRSQTFSFQLPGQVSGSEVAYYISFASKNVGNSATLTEQSNGTRTYGTGSAVFNKIDSEYSNATHALIRNLTGKCKNISGTLSLKLSLQSSSNLEKARLNYIRVAYERALSLESGQLVFRINSAAPGNNQVELKGCSSDTRVWDVTEGHAPVEIPLSVNGSVGRFVPVASGDRKYVAFTLSAVTATPSKVSNIENQNIHGIDVPDMLIITLPAFKSEAERVAKMHERVDGMNVVVLTPDEIFNEFSSGVPDVTAFRKVMKMWYDRRPDGTGLRYCLLVGRPSYDQRGLTDKVKRQSYPRLLTWESPNSYTEGSSYCFDNYIGMLEDDDSKTFKLSSRKINVSVGRMPVKTMSEAKVAVDKLIRYVESPELGPWRNNVMIIADDADRAVHLEQAQTIYGALRKSGNGEGFLYERLYLDSYPLGKSKSKTIPAARTRMLKMFEQGVSMIDYIGHANPTSWTHEQLLTYSDIVGMSNTRLPILTAYTCEFVRFDADEVSGAEIMWLNPTAGAIAFIAANRQVGIASNGILNRYISTNYFARDEDNRPRRLGDIFRIGMNEAYNSSDNNMRYALMGDPAMRIASPLHKVAVDKIGNHDVSENSDSPYPVVGACSKMVVKGHVEDYDGRKVADFNGKVSVILYDAERVIETYGHQSKPKDWKDLSDKEKEEADGIVSIYNDRKNVLSNAVVEVKDGEWELTLILPFEIDNNYSPALLSMYAWSEDGRDANGSFERFYVYGYDDETSDDIVDPEIKVLALNSESFRDGGIVGENPVVIARLFDESGINISSSGIGHQMYFVIDGRVLYNNVTDYYTLDLEDNRSGRVEYPLSGLPEGEHTLAFTAWDNVGNVATKEIKFRVMKNAVASIQDIFTNASPAKTDVTFFVSHTVASPQAVVKVDVYDIGGRKVWSGESTGSSQIEWNLNDFGGHRVPRGIYVCRATVTADDGTECHASRKLAVAAP